MTRGTKPKKVSGNFRFLHLGASNLNLVTKTLKIPAQKINLPPHDRKLLKLATGYMKFY